tara:strand:- start:57557 stop:57958 length:402 start_codon:yes stop_codon:yes gene_type:complete
MEDCIFCKIVKGEVPCKKIYEDEETLAFLDISPVAKGHTLVVPKKHVVTLVDIDEETLKKVIVVVKKLTIAANKYSEGVTVGQNNNRASGQVVDHVHFHIIPRTEGDGLDPWPRVHYVEGEAGKIAEEIKSLL